MCNESSESWWEKNDRLIRLELLISLFGVPFINTWQLIVCIFMSVRDMSVYGNDRESSSTESSSSYKSTEQQHKKRTNRQRRKTRKENWQQQQNDESKCMMSGRVHCIATKLLQPSRTTSENCLFMQFILWNNEEEDNDSADENVLKKEQEHTTLTQVYCTEIEIDRERTEREKVCIKKRNDFSRQNDYHA